MGVWRTPIELIKLWKRSSFQGLKKRVVLILQNGTGETEPAKWQCVDLALKKHFTCICSRLYSKKILGTLRYGKCTAALSRRLMMMTKTGS